MSKKIVATITEASYQDDYEMGEVDGTYQIIDIETKMFDSVVDAIKYFKDNYSRHEEKKICYEPSAILDDNGNAIPMFVAPWPMQQVTPTEFFADAPDYMIKEWEQGKINLWSVETRMTLSVETPVTSEMISDEAEIKQEWFY